MDIQFRKILCPVDFSKSSDYAYLHALAIAARHGATVELLHVGEHSAYSQDEVDGKTYDDTLEECLRDIADSSTTDVPIETKLVLGVPYVEIVNRATAWPADLIVIGTHGRTGLKHLLIGSVAEKVVRTASCPVCAVRHPDHVVSLGNGEAK